MIRLLYCLFLMIPLVVIPVLLFLVSTGLGIVASVVSAVLAIPLLIATFAHADLVRSKSRYGLRKEELAEFVRLVPRLAGQPEYGGLSGGDRSRTAKQAAAEVILSRRTARDGGHAR